MFHQIMMGIILGRIPTSISLARTELCSHLWAFNPFRETGTKVLIIKISNKMLSILQMGSLLEIREMIQSGTIVLIFNRLISLDLRSSNLKMLAKVRIRDCMLMPLLTPIKMMDQRSQAAIFRLALQLLAATNVSFPL